MNFRVRKDYINCGELGLCFFHDDFCVKLLTVQDLQFQYRDVENVILYVWSLLIKDRSAPFLSGVREPIFCDSTPPTLPLKNFDWLPPLKVRNFEPQNLGELTCSFQWKKVQARIQWILELWLKRPLPLKVVQHVVTPYEMLKLQSEGCRIVTLPLDHKDLSQDVVPGKRAFEFVLHDLEHAERFFHNETNYYGQVGFYHHLQKSVENGFWQPYLENIDFQTAFFYLMSDMNTHCVHMLKYLRANLWTFFNTNAEEIWQEFIHRVIQEVYVLPAFVALNTKDERSNHLVEIEDYFVKFGRRISPQEFF